MAFINTPSTLAVGSSTSISITASEINTILPSDGYFKDTLDNWRMVRVIYWQANGQNKKLNFYNDDNNNFGSATLDFSSTARTGAWLIQKIMIFDYDNGYTVLLNNDIPSASSYNITVSSN